MQNEKTKSYADDSRVCGQTDAHHVTSGVEGRPRHRLDGGWPRDALHAQLVHDVVGEIDLVEHKYGLGQVETGELDLMQIEELVDVLPAALLNTRMLFVEDSF